MKLVDKFNEFCTKQTEKKNQRLLEKYYKIKDESPAVGFLALVGLVVFPPLLIPVIFHAEKEQRLKKKLQKRGVAVPE